MTKGHHSRNFHSNKRRHVRAKGPNIRGAQIAMLRVYTAERVKVEAKIRNLMQTNPTSPEIASLKAQATKLHEQIRQAGNAMCLESEQ